MTAILVLSGLGLLVAGGEALVRGAIGLAKAGGVSPMVIALTVIACGTSAPELVVCVEAALSGFPGIAVGNIVGSNVANLLLIVGAAALVYPMACRRNDVVRNGAVLAGGTAVFTLVCLDGMVERIAGIGLSFLLVVYILGSWWLSRRGLRMAVGGPEEAEEVTDGPWLAVLLTAAGLGGVLLGAHLLVVGSVDLARMMGISETTIGLTVVAFGTSLPELATVVAAAVRRRPELAFGNIIGSNIFNLLGIMGITATVTPVAVPAQVVDVDLWVMAAATIGVLVAMYTGSRVTRGEGAVMLAVYIGYFVILLGGFMPLHAV